MNFMIYKMIKITSHSNFDTICYSLPLVTGTVVGAEDGEIEVNCMSTELVATHWPIIKGKFKILVNLIPGRNCIILKYKCYSEELHLTYEPLQFKQFIRLVYITCCDNDGAFQAPSNEDNSIESACSRIALGAQMLQTFTAAKVNAHGLDYKTFQLEEIEGRPVCHEFKSSLHLDEALKLSETELWEHFAMELMKSDLRVGDDCKFLGILSFTRYANSSGTIPKSFKEFKNWTHGYVALAAGGLALLGSACLHTWPQTLAEVPWRFGDSRKINQMQFMDDSRNRGWYWACYATTLGATMHELGHIFNLGHTSDGIMSRGFDNIHKFFIIDMFYCSHPFQKKYNPNYQKSVHEKENSVSFMKSSSISWTANQKATKAKESNFNSKTERRSALNITKRNVSNKPPWRVPDPPEGDLRSKSNDDAFWARSSALILYYHKWFNDFDDDDDEISRNGSTFSSPHGIRVVEFRDDEGTAIHHLEFLDGTGISQIDVAVLDLKCYIPENATNVYVHVQDSHGCICQHEFSSQMFMNCK